MKNADTAIVANGTFTHYCHKRNTLKTLPVHHYCCPICSQKNPDYIPNQLVHVVCNLSGSVIGSVVMIFRDQLKAVQYIQDHPNDNLAFCDTGYIS